MKKRKQHYVWEHYQQVLAEVAVRIDDHDVVSVFEIRTCHRFYQPALTAAGLSEEEHVPQTLLGVDA